MSDAAQIWSYLSTGPLLWLTLTVAVYALASAVARRVGNHPAANPVLLSMTVLGALLVLTGTPYQAYFDGAQFIHFMLGPATIALAVPFFANRNLLRKSALPVLAALICGSLAAILSTVALSLAFGLPRTAIVSIAPKSTTAPVALGISEALGGQPTLTAVIVIVTGITGALVVTPLMNFLRIRDWRARGFAVGIAAHGIGTARAFQVNEIAGAFAGIGLALNAVLTSLVVPIIVSLFLPQ